MQVHQATFGAVGKGHALISASPGAADLASRFTGRTDLPNTAPVGLEWKPFESLLVDHHHVVLMRTWPDTSAARGGMVFTHALFVRLEQAQTLQSLDALAALLPASPTRDSAPATLELGPTPTAASSECAATLLDALIKQPENSAPIVWLGEDGLLQCVSALWGRLPPAIRRTLTFRLSFGPEDIPSTQPRFVSTPRALKPRWQGKTLIDPTESQSAPSGVAATLTDEGSAADLQRYAEKFGIEISSVKDFSLQFQSWSLTRQERRDFASRIDETRLLLHLSPDPMVGTDAKEQLVEDIAQGLATASPDEVLSIRNLAIDRWNCGDSLWRALSAWCAVAARSVEGDEAVWRNAFAGTPVANWSAAVLEGLDRGLREGNQNWPSWWRRWLQDPSLIEPVLDRLRDKITVENELLASCPAAVERGVGDVFLAPVAKNAWWRLHARIARRSRPVGDALEAQLRVDRDVDEFGGLQELLVEVEPDDAIDLAVERGERRLLKLAGRAAGQFPKTLNRFDIRNSNWREVWRIAHEANPQAWQGIENQDDVRSAASGLIQLGGELDEVFLGQLALTPLGDFHSVPDRQSLWEKIPEPARSALLKATARGWLLDFSSADFSTGELEERLRRQITSIDEASWYLGGCGSSPISALRYFEHFDNSREADCVAWLNRTSSSTRLTRPDAERLGHLARNRRWQQLSNRIVQLLLSYSRQDLAPAISMIRGQVSWIDHMSLYMRGFVETQPTAAEIWSILEDVVADLYSDGPKDSEIWSRSGGKNSELPTANNGRGKWHAAIDLLKRGGASTTAARLIKHMRRDHPNNEHLRWLEGWDVLGSGEE